MICPVLSEHRCVSAPRLNLHTPGGRPAAVPPSPAGGLLKKSGGAIAALDDVAVSGMKLPTARSRSGQTKSRGDSTIIPQHPWAKGPALFPRTTEVALLSLGRRMELKAEPAYDPGVRSKLRRFSKPASRDVQSYAAAAGPVTCERQESCRGLRRRLSSDGRISGSVRLATGGERRYRAAVASCVGASPSFPPTGISWCARARSARCRGR